jgi:hypothetical protein
MMTLFLLLVFLATAGLIWLHGLWGAAVTLINMTIAMLIAMNLFEPLSDVGESQDASFTFLFDFVMLWMVFFFTFGFLRLITDMLSKTRVKFDLPIEMAGRSILAIWCGWLMVCFTAFSLMMAPLNSESPLGAWETPRMGSFLGMAPERLWLGFIHSRSRGALSRGKIEDGPDAHPDDESLNVEAFDPFGEFPIKYHERRVKYAAEEQMRVAQ